MKGKDSKFIKLSFNKQKGNSTLEMSCELQPLTKEEIRRIKKKNRQHALKH